MFIVQTYFSDEIAGRADAYVYYVELPGNSVEPRESVLEAFRELGEEYGREVSLFFPDLKSVSQVRAEIKRELGDLFGIGGKATPCIIVSPRPIGNTAHRRDWVYLSLRSKLDISTAEISSLVRDLVDTVKTDSLSKGQEGVLRRIWDALEMKPGGFGFSLDLKKLFEKRSAP